MKQTYFTRELNHFFVPLSLLHLLLLLLLLIPFVFIIRKNIGSHFTKRHPLPPGPKPWPIIGNLLHIAKSPLHISLTNLAKTHGPLISLKLGTQILVVGSTPQAAKEILRTHDRLLSARCLPKTSPFDSHVLDRIAIIWATECTDEWKSLRGLCRTQLFSSKAVESQAILREKKAGEMVEFLISREGKVVNVGEVVFSTIFNTTANLLFSKDVIDFENGAGSRLKNTIWKILEITAAPNISDFYPILSRLDPQGLRRMATKWIEEIFTIWGIYVNERRKSHVPDGPKRDFLDVFLANGFGDDQINWLFIELFTAATDTTTTTIEWAMAELLKNKEAMKRVREELRREIGNGKLQESHVSQLPHLNACVKETLRLHPPAPFLVPHRALETCEIMNYTIPKDCKVIVNVLAIGRDPTIWEDPLSFKPERFLFSNLDVKGQDFELIPFGSGRRSCPGLPIATKQVSLILASLVHLFDWSLVDGKDPTASIDLKEKFGITLQKEQPLLLVPTELRL